MIFSPFLTFKHIYLEDKMFYSLIKTKDVLMYTYKMLKWFGIEAGILLVPLSQESLVVPVTGAERGLCRSGLET